MESRFGPLPSITLSVGAPLALPLNQLSRRLLCSVLLLLSLSIPRARGEERIPIFAITNVWKFNQTANLDQVNWKAPGFDDSKWRSGPALLYSETNAMVTPRNTELIIGRNTYYFRTHFHLDSMPQGFSLVFSNLIDDGAVFYLNGTEIQRLQMPPAPQNFINYDTYAADWFDVITGDATSFEVFTAIGEALTNAVVGDNVLAVEVHQITVGSSDIAFGCSLTAVIDPSVIDHSITWSLGGGGIVNDEARGVAMDQAGNSFVVGSFSGRTSFGNTNLASKGISDAFLAKFTPAGVLVWVQPLGGINTDQGDAVAIDPSGNVIVAGRFSRSTVIGSIPLTGTYTTLSNHFLAKFSADGQVLWAKSADGLSSRVAVDRAGNIFVSGLFSKTAKIGPVTLTATNAYNVSLTRYDADGNVVWSRSTGGNNASIASLSQSIGIATDGPGNVYLTTTFNVPFLYSEVIRTNRSPDDTFLAKFTAAGEPAWVRQISGGVRDQEHAVATDSQENVYLVAPFQGKADFGSGGPLLRAECGLLIAKYESSGSLVWVRSFEGTNSARGLCLDAADNLYVSGAFSGRGVFGDSILQSRGSSDAYLVRWSPEGALSWTRRLGGTGADVALGIAADKDANLTMAGSFGSTLYFSDRSLSTRGDGDLFVIHVLANTKPGPALALSHEGDGVTISWPGQFSGFVLETSSSSQPFHWEVSTAPIVVLPDQFQSHIQAEGIARFFRLSKP